MNFLRKEILYLGHVISIQGISPDVEKVRVFKEYPTPQDADAVKRFVAFTNYYISFIPQFADIVASLNKLSSKNVTFEWTPECDKAFQELKLRLIQPPILKYTNFSTNNRFILKN